MSPPSSPHSHSRSPSSPLLDVEHRDDDESLLEISLGDSSYISSCSPSFSSLSTTQESTILPPSTTPSQQHSSAKHTDLSSIPSLTSSTNIALDAPAPLSEAQNIDRAPQSTVDVDSQSTLPITTTSSTLSLTSVSNKTPNLYINGLPPNFPEDELYALTASFGEVRSVRTFTRHVGDRTSGYGFVLFDSIESAEKCMEGLKQYRNLHPSFSKQIHKIPGTMYGSRVAHSESTISDAFSSSRPDSSLRRAEDEDDNSFKVRMERLRDDTSTNLYIEGLPLSIDEATMTALVSPYTIKSSRFFETKLSHPPRIIAFVRLETRAAAEEIIERLHGRMVRGWNDPGSRISVRFADTSEQRELRRTERMTREGDQSLGKLTIAQAALLNLRGQEYQAQIHAGLRQAVLQAGQLPHHPQLHLNNTLPPGASATGLSPGFEGNSIRSETAGYAHVRGTEYGHSAIGEYHPHARQLQHHSTHFGSHMPVSALSTPYAYPQHDAVAPEFGLLLDSQRRGGVPLTTDQRGLEYNISDADYTLQSQVPTSLIGLSQAQARNGYTPAEELILRAHAQVNTMRGARTEASHSRKDSTSLRAAPGVDIGMGVRGQRSKALTMTYPQRTRVSLSHVPNSPIDSLASMSEDEFQSSATNHHASYQQFVVDGDARLMHQRNEDISGLSRDFDAILLLQQQQQQNTPFSYEPQIQTHALSQYQNQQERIQMHAPHIRATTLPQSSHSQGSTQHQRLGHFQHSSMSVVDGRRTKPNHSGSQDQNQNTIHHQMQGSAHNHYHDQIHNPKQKRNPPQNQHGNNGGAIFDHNDSTQTRGGSHFVGNCDRGQGVDATTYESSQFGLGQRQPRLAPKFVGGPDAYEEIGAMENAGSPPLVSPALTYSSRTPASLSPATPFFGSFGHAGEGFEGPAVGLDGKKGVGGGVGSNVVSSSGGL